MSVLSKTQVKRAQHFLKRFYLRVHPDLVASHCETSGRENEKSIQSLNTILSYFQRPEDSQSIPTGNHRLRFNVLNESKTALNRVTTSIRVENEDFVLERGRENLYLRVLDSLREPLRKADVSDWDDYVQKTRDELHFTGEGVDFDEKHLGSPNVEANLDHVFTIWDRDKGLDMLEDNYERKIQGLISRLFKKNRIQFLRRKQEGEGGEEEETKAEVDEADLVENVIDTLRYFVSPHDLLSLNTEIFSDIILLFGGQEYTRLGRSIIFPYSFSPIQAAQHLQSCLENIQTLSSSNHSH
mmetsp:Transcript_16304/g.18461  ORF Transcript_16304/g.18461 Transcript_16304/m.18461 type:complete len:298 (-) Transcript_16304:39-932(-)